MADLSDDELLRCEERIAAAKGGDRDAFGELSQIFREDLLQIAKRKTGGRPDLSHDDFVQLALEAAWRSMAGFRGANVLQFLAWLKVVLITTINQTIRFTTAKKRHPGVIAPLPGGGDRDSQPQLQPADSQTSPSEAARRKEMHELLWEALEQLPDVEREILSLRYIEGWKWSEIGEKVGLTPAQVQSRHRAALDKLEKILGTGGVCL